MKQQYETPKAQKFEFDYKGTVTASGNAGGGNGKPGNSSGNSCFIGNGANVVTGGCIATNNKQKKKC